MVGKRDIVKGKVEQGAGKVKEEIGDATDNPRMERRGQGEQVRGHMREGMGRAKRTLSGKD